MAGNSRNVSFHGCGGQASKPRCGQGCAPPRRLWEDPSRLSQLLVAAGHPPCPLAGGGIAPIPASLSPRPPPGRIFRVLSSPQKDTSQWV